MEKFSTQFVELGDVKLAYREYGEGSALILLHGNSSSKEFFTEYQQFHFRAFHTFAIDSRGHGETRSTDEKYSFDQYSDDVIAFCRSKGIAQSFVIGYSDGGNLALFLAKKAPEIFTRIAAISPNYLVSGTTDDSLKAIQSAAKVFRFLMRLGLPTRKAVMRFDLMLNDIGLTAEDLKDIRTRMRILYAEHDMIKETHILEMGRLIPGATVRKINNCTHLDICQQPEAIEDMKAFFMEAL